MVRKTQVDGLELWGLSNNLDGKSGQESFMVKQREAPCREIEIRTFSQGHLNSKSLKTFDLASLSR